MLGSLANKSDQLHGINIQAMAPSKVADLDISATSPANNLSPLSTDYHRQLVSKQQKNNYHSSSLGTMISKNSVNQTNLHPGGVEYVLKGVLATASKAFPI